MSKNLNLPNILALFRIALAPLMLWFFINRDNSLFSSWHPSWFDYFAGLVFVIASVTDFFDGFIARADVWAVFLILSREFFITGLRVVAVAEGKNVASTMVGKVKTVAQMFAIGFLIMNWPYATTLLWFAVALTLYSGFEYTRDYFKA